MKWRPSLTEYSKITACPNCIFSSEVVLYREAFNFTHFLFSALNSILDSHFKPHLILIISFHPLSFLRTFHLYRSLFIASFVTSSLPPSFPPSLPPSFPPSLPPSLPPSFSLSISLSISLSLFLSLYRFSYPPLPWLFFFVQLPITFQLFSFSLQSGHLILV